MGESSRAAASGGLFRTPRGPVDVAADPVEIHGRRAGKPREFSAWRWSKSDHRHILHLAGLRSTGPRSLAPTPRSRVEREQAASPTSNHVGSAAVVAGVLPTPEEYAEL